VAYIHILDLIGVFAFAAYGSHKAIVARFDLFGVLACGALTAFGGGTIRELILNSAPAYLSDYSYLIAAIVGTVFAIAVHRHFARLEKYLLVVDAIGLAVFAYIGAHQAATHHLGLAAMVLFATLTAVGGGILSDLVSGRRPEALYKDAYPLPAIFLAIMYYLMQPLDNSSLPALSLIIAACVVRLLSLSLSIRLWRPAAKAISPKARNRPWWQRLFTLEFLTKYY